MRIQATWISKINISQERFDIYKAFFKPPVHGERKYSWVKDLERPMEMKQLWQGKGADIQPKCPCCRDACTLWSSFLSRDFGNSGVQGSASWHGQWGWREQIPSRDFKQKTKHTTHLGVRMYLISHTCQRLFLKNVWVHIFQKGSAPFQSPVGEPNFQKCFMLSDKASVYWHVVY